MLDMGFIHDVKRVIAAAARRSGRRCSSRATMPPEIQALSESILKDPAKVEVVPQSTTAETVEQRLYFVEREQKRHLLVHLLGDASIRRALVFTRTKHGANRVTKQLAGGAHLARRPSTATRARTRASGRWTPSRTAAAGCWWPRTSPRAASTSRASPTSSTSICPTSPSPTCTASAARAARARRASRSPSATARSARTCKDIERTIRRSVPVVADHPFRSGQPCPRPGDVGPGRRGVAGRASGTLAASGTRVATRATAGPGGRRRGGGGGGGDGPRGERQAAPAGPRVAQAAGGGARQRRGSTGAREGRGSSGRRSRAGGSGCAAPGRLPPRAPLRSGSEVKRAPVTLLRAANVQLSFGSRTVFEGLTFTIEEGERVGLVGVNGSGKSSLMKILAGASRAGPGRAAAAPRRPRHLPAAGAGVPRGRHGGLGADRRRRAPLREALAAHAELSRKLESTPAEAQRASCWSSSPRCPIASSSWAAGTPSTSAKMLLDRLGVKDWERPVARAVRRAAQARGDRPGAADPAGSAAAGRAHQPPGRGHRGLAGGGAGQAPGRAAAGHPRSLLPGRAGGPDRGDPARRGRRLVPRQLRGVPGAEAGGAGERGRRRSTSASGGSPRRWPGCGEAPRRGAPRARRASSGRAS